MSTTRDKLRDIHYRASDLIARVIDELAEELSQAEREVEDLLVSLVRARREAPEAQGGEP